MECRCGGVAQVVASPEESVVCKACTHRGPRWQTTQGETRQNTTVKHKHRCFSLIITSCHHNCMSWKRADKENMHSSLQQRVKLEHLLCSRVIKRYGHYKPVALQLSVSRAPAGNNVRSNLKVKSQRGRQLQMDVSQLFCLLLYIKTQRCMSPF